MNLLTATIRVGKAKTDAGSYRELDLPRGLVTILETWWKQSEGLRQAWAKKHPGEEPVFLTKVKGGRYSGQIIRQSEANVTRRLKTAIKHANVKLAELGIEPISDRVTPHSLRRTYASFRAALGDDPLYVSEQMGHKDVRFTLNVYSKAVKRRAKLSGAYLAEFDRALLGQISMLHPLNGRRRAHSRLKERKRPPRYRRKRLGKANLAPWRSGYAAACKAMPRVRPIRPCKRASAHRGPRAAPLDPSRSGTVRLGLGTGAKTGSGEAMIRHPRRVYT